MKTSWWMVSCALVSLSACDSSNGDGPATPVLYPSFDAGAPNNPFPDASGPSKGESSFDAGAPEFFPPNRLPENPITQARRPPPISGGTLAVSPDGTTVVAADPDRDAVFIVKPHEPSVTRVPFGIGAEPGRVVFDRNGRVHVALRQSGRIATIDTNTAGVVATTEVCSFPRGIAYDAAADAVVTACASGDLVTVNASTLEVLSRTFVDQDLRDVLIGKDGRRFVTRFRSAEVLELASDGSIVSRSRPASSSEQRFSFENRPVRMSANTAWRTTMSESGQLLMLHQRSLDDEVPIGSKGMGLGGGYGGSGSGCESVVQSTFSTIVPGSTTPAQLALNGATLAVDVALSADGVMTAVASAGEHMVGTGDGLLVYASADVPEGSPDAGVGCRSSTIPTDTVGEQFTAVAFFGNDRLYALTRDPAQLQVFSITRYSADLEVSYQLAKDSVRDTGHDLFHSNVGGGIACASCHAEGTDDGRVWKFTGLGARRTQNMRGGLAGTAPFHWDGDMRDFQHLVDEVMTGRMSGFPVEPRFSDALFTWIDALPALRLPARDVAAVERGKVLFEAKDTACLTCHKGNAFTNNATVDVGTGGAFQVPSLVNLGLRAPFMHNGCAATLEQRFEPKCGGGDQHGKTSHLTPAQIKDLSLYLETL